MSAEAIDFGFGNTLEARRIAAGLAIVTVLGSIAASCKDEQGGGGGISPIDTNGTRGSGYSPPRRDHRPHGMEMLEGTVLDENRVEPVPVFNDNRPPKPAILRIPPPELMMPAVEPQQELHAA
jgi:hypothetical protein